jgi:hypothetical protein
MSEDEQLLSEKESLRLIAEMINRSKNSFVDSGIGPLCWGILVTFCSITTFLALQFNFELPFNVWLLTFIALIPQVYFSSKRKKTRQFVTHDEEVVRYTWTAFAITIFLITHYSIQIHPSDSNSLFLLLYGIPTFITGGMKRFKPMIAGGIVCWICCIIAVYTSLKADMLLIALSATCAWLIPGIMLRRKYLKLKHV